MSNPAHPWIAEVDHSLDRLAASLRAALPGFAFERFERMGAGWDNTAVLVDDRWVFRFARRTVAARLLRNERVVLGAVAPDLPLDVPRPVWFGDQLDTVDGETLPLLGYERLAGRTGCGVDWDARCNTDAAAKMGTFLRFLHRTTVPTSLTNRPSSDVNRRADLPLRYDGMRDIAQKVVASRPALRDDIGRALQQAAALVDTAPAHEERLVHGDLYIRHILVDAADAPTGVIDWGDAHVGDAALDLNLAFAWLRPGEDRDAFFASYQMPVDQAALRRARFRALHYGILLLWYGADIDDKDLERAGQRALANAAIEGPTPDLRR